MKPKKEFETYLESHNIPDVFSFSEKENEKQFLNENFVFNSEENASQTGTDLNINSSGIEDNDNYRELNKTEKDDDDDRKEDKNNDSNSQTQTSSSSSSSSSSASSAASSSGGLAATIAATATAAVVAVVGGGIVLNSSYKEPTVCQFQEVVAIDNSVHFVLVLMADEEKSDTETIDETDCVIEISCPVLSYSDTFDAKYFGVVEGNFENLEYNTEYSLTVYRPTMLGADKEYICDPVNISTPKKGEVVLSELTISGTYQTEFYVGETFNYEGLVVTAHYSDGFQRNLEYSEVTISTPDMSSVGDKEVEITYTEGEITLTTSYLINVIDNVVSSIELSGDYQYKFYTGDEFNHNGLIVTAIYKNGSSKVLEDGSYIVEAPDMSYAGDKEVEITYTEGEITLTTSYIINVIDKVVSSIELGGEYLTSFYTGDEFSYEGLVVTATYEDGTSRELTDDEYSISEPDLSVAGSQTVTVSYNENINASYTIEVIKNTIFSIELSGDYQYKFYTGDEFNHNGLIVTAIYKNGSSKVLEDGTYSVEAPDMSYSGGKYVEVSYTEDGITKRESYEIVVVDGDLESITLSGDYKTKFSVGEEFDHSGLIVTAHYSDGSTKIRADSELTFDIPDLTYAHTAEVTVTYTELDITKTASYTIEISDSVVKFISLSGDYAKTFYTGDEFSYEGLVVTATYEDGTSRELTDDEYSVSEPDLTVTGEQSIIVSYSEKILATYKIEVLKNTIFSIELSGDYQYKFYTGDEFNHDGLIVTAVYRNGSTKVIEDGSYVIEAPDMSYAGGKYVEVSYTEDGITKRESYEIVVVDGDLESITISGTYKTTFVAGDEFNHDGLIVTAHYSDGSTKIRADSELQFDVPDLTYAHTAEVTVSYTELGITKSETYRITVVDALVESITLSGDYQTEYCVGDVDLNLEGLIVTAHYSDSSSVTVSTNLITYETPDFSTAGEKEVTISYTESGVTVNASFNITVENIQPVSLNLEGGTQTTNFHTGDDFSYEGLSVKAEYNDGSYRELNEEEYTVIAPDMTTAGSKTVYVNAEVDYVQLQNSYVIQVSDLTIMSISVTEYKDTYIVGEEFDLSSITLLVEYDDGSTDLVYTPDFTCDEPDMSVIGPQTVTIHYGELSTEITIQINES